MSCQSPERPGKPLNRWVTLLLLIALLPAGQGLALPGDRDQPIHITADQALRDEKKGLTVYSGNVRMNQGSLSIDADKLTIFHRADEVGQIIAEGDPARMQEQPEPDKGMIYARARVITYYRDEDRVHLQQDAHIERDGAIVTGNSIDYLIAEQLVRADSDHDQSGSRVQVVIPPQAIPQEDKDDGATVSE